MRQSFHRPGTTEEDAAAVFPADEKEDSRGWMFGAAAVGRRNLKRESGRSLALFVIVLLFAFVLSAGLFLLFSMQKGIQSSVDRLGADLLIVPPGYDSKIRGAILRGEPNNFYLDGKVLDEAKKIEGLKKLSPQLYIATLQAGCCSVPLQIIGFDDRTDFNIIPWISKSAEMPLKNGDIVVGYNISGKPGTELTFFNKQYRIAAKLRKTGMGFDNSVFMNMETAKKIALDTRRKGEHPALGNTNPISVVMVRLEEGYDVRETMDRINRHFKGEAYALTTQNIMREARGSFRALSFYLYSLIVLLALISFIVLSLIFTMIFRERREEFATWRMLGAGKRWIRRIMLSESTLIGVGGSLSGVLLGIFFAVCFGYSISLSAGLPYLEPDIGRSLLLGAVAFLLAFATGPLASLFVTQRKNRKERAKELEKPEPEELESCLRKKSEPLPGAEAAHITPESTFSGTVPSPRGSDFALLFCNDLSKCYYRGRRLFAALNRVTFHLQKGDFAQITGASGSGKSTFLNLVCGLITPDTGNVSLLKENVSALSEEARDAFRNRHIGFIPQTGGWLFHLTVEENIAAPLILRGKTPVQRGSVRGIAERLGIEELLSSYPDELSGGEIKRMLIARALLQKPELLIADEPTADLDSENAAQVLEIFRSLNEEGLSILMVTHELDALPYGKTHYAMRDGVLTQVKREAGIA